MQAPNFFNAHFDILSKAAQVELQHMGAQLARMTDWTVMGGCFEKMRLPAKASWGEGDFVPKILGVYEQELQPAVEKAIARQPDLVINVGCAEGYYTVGLARRLPNARVHAFDISEAAQTVCAAAAAENGVGGRVTVHGRCTDADLVALVRDAKRALLVIDCEGGELDILSETAIAALGHCDLIVECHDFINRQITPTLEARLAGSHKVTRQREGPRDPSAIPALRGLTSLDRWLCVCEFRPELMHWLIAWGADAA